MRALLCIVPLFIALTACESNVDPGPQEPANEQIQAACVAPVGEPVEHSGEISGNEVWKADQIHVVRGHVNVRDGGRLVIEPCATVRLEEGAFINVAFPVTPNQGELIAEGTAERPIRFEGLDGARWGHIQAVTPGRVRLAHVTLDGGGAVGDVGETLWGQGDQAFPIKPVLSLDHVTIKNSLGPGVRLDRGASFESASAALTITGSGSEAHPYPVSIDEYALDSLPDGNYKGNRVDQILIEPGVVAGKGGLQKDATIHDRGVPYVVGTTPKLDNFSIGWGDDDIPQPTLTIEAGVRMLFLAGSGFRVVGRPSGAATLRALGTAEKPVVFSSAAASPAAGDWQGFFFNGPVNASNTLEHVRIEYTGADCGCIMVSCNANVTEYEGAILFTQPPPSMFLTSSVIAHGRGHGVVQGFDGNSLDWLQGNDFEALSGCRQTLPRDAEAHCPAPMPSCN